MADELTPTTDPTEPLTYEVRIQGHLDADWADWLGGLTLTLEQNGETLLTGPQLDQAALHSLLKKVRDLGLTLISVCQVHHSEKEIRNGTEQK